MILVLAGAAEGREIVKALAQAGHLVLACAATPYGAKLLEGSGAAAISGRPLGGEEIRRLLDANKVAALVDATHPYAEEISAIALQACRDRGVRYIRYQRPPAPVPDHPLVHRAKDYPEAAEKACDLGDIVFLATGSKTLEIFLREAARKGCRVVARVLPQPEVLRKCLELGLEPSDIVAMQGPFSEEINIALLRHYQASVLVTKDGGSPGGAGEKYAAAIKLGLPVVVVDRPEAPPGAVASLADLLKIINKEVIFMETAVVLLSHGSRLPEAKATLEAYQKMVMSTGLFKIVEAASLQFNQPDLPAAMDVVVARGARRVIVVPLFLYQGMHMQHDIPELLAGEREKYPGVEIILAGNIGADERVGQIILDRIREVS